MIRDRRNVVYEITIGNYKQIGSTCDIRYRMNAHKRALSRNTHWNSFMQSVWNKHQQFDVKIIMECETRERAYQEEQKLLDQYFGKPNFMMQTSSAFGAAKGRVSPMKGRKNTPEHIKKRSDAKRGQKMTAEQRLNVSLGHIKLNMKILQYDLNDHLIKEWPSIQDLKSKFEIRGVMRCCRGERKTAFKFKWKFEEVNHVT